MKYQVSPTCRRIVVACQVARVLLPSRRWTDVVPNEGGVEQVTPKVGLLQCLVNVGCTETSSMKGGGSFVGMKVSARGV